MTDLELSPKDLREAIEFWLENRVLKHPAKILGMALKDPHAAGQEPRGLAVRLEEPDEPA